jgi:hypothetical protein
MKRNAFLFGLILLASTLFGCASKQHFSNSDARYVVTWRGNNINRLRCWGDKIPGGFVEVMISRKDSALQKVSVNRKQEDIWSEVEFTDQADIVRNCGVVFHADSQFAGSKRLITREWRFETNGVSIYKEVVLLTANGGTERREFYGPFGVELHAPR